MISFTYLKLVFSRNKWDLTPEQAHQFVQDKLIPALQTMDFDHDGRITVKEVIRAAVNVIVSCLH